MGNILNDIHAGAEEDVDTEESLEELKEMKEQMGSIEAGDLKVNDVVPLGDIPFVLEGHFSPEDFARFEHLLKETMKKFEYGMRLRRKHND